MPRRTDRVMMKNEDSLCLYLGQPTSLILSARAGSQEHQCHRASVGEMRRLGVLRIVFGVHEEFGEARCLINTLGLALYDKQTC